MRKTELTEAELCAAVAEMAAGLVDADLSGGVVEKRVALPGRGKSGGTRTLVATNKGSRWFFVFGFEKSDRANIGSKELDAVQQLAVDLLRLSSSQLDEQVASEALKEICHDIQSEGRRQDPGRGSRDRA